MSRSATPSTATPPRCYATAILQHGPFGIGEGRFIIKVDDGIFDQLTIDKDRNWIMPSSRDWDAGTPLNLSKRPVG